MTENAAQKKRDRLYVAIARLETAIRKDATAPESNEFVSEKLARALDTVYHRIADLEDASYSLGWSEAKAAVEKLIRSKAR